MIPAADRFRHFLNTVSSRVAAPIVVVVVTSAVVAADVRFPLLAFALESFVILDGLGLRGPDFAGGSEWLDTKKYILWHQQKAAWPKIKPG